MSGGHLCRRQKHLQSRQARLAFHNIIYESFKAAFIDVQKIDGLNGGVSLSFGICLIIISLICRYGAEATGTKRAAAKIYSH